MVVLPVVVADVVIVLEPVVLPEDVAVSLSVEVPDSDAETDWVLLAELLAELLAVEVAVLRAQP